MASKTDQGLALLYDDIVITLGALGANSVAITASKIDAARENGFRVIKTQYWIDWQGKTAVEGPVIVGYAFGMDANAISATISSDPQSSNLDFVDGETKNPVFPMELIPFASTDGGGATPGQGGFTMGEVVPRWSVPEGSNLNWFARNLGGAGMTTGTVVLIFAKHFGVWLRD